MVKKVVSVLFLFACFSFAELPNGDLIKVHAKILPQLLFFEESIKQSDTPIVIVVIYNNNATKQVAEAYKQATEALYGDNIKGRHLSVDILSPDECLKRQENATAIYIAAEGKLGGGKKNNVITFAASKQTFTDDGALFYTEISNKTTIFVNARILKASKFKFSNSFLKQVRVIDNE